jgi:hypothetical protein
VGALGAAAAVLAARDDAWVGRAVWAAGLAVSLMWAVVSGSSVRTRYHADVARDLQLRGHIEDALHAEDRARRYGGVGPGADGARAPLEEGPP